MRSLLARLGVERRALLHPEAVLLVNDDQAQLGELHALLQQRVRAHHDASVPRRGVEQCRAATARTQRSGQELHPGGLGSAVEHAAARERAEHGGDRAVVLSGQHLGRGQQNRLSAGVDGLQHRTEGDNGLARANLPLQQPVHRARAGELGGQGLTHRALPSGERERHHGVEGVQQPAGAHGPRSGRKLLAGDALAGEHRLHHQRLLEAQTPPGRLDLRLGGRPVDALQRVTQAEKTVLCPDRRWDRIVLVLEVVDVIERQVNGASDDPARQRSSGRVDREHRSGESLEDLRARRCGRPATAAPLLPASS
jgi:hypothetical protein